MKNSTILFLLLSLSIQLISQEKYNFDTIIEEIGALENAKDPKCHATASRLENFMYGTPLTSEARNARIEFQQKFVRHIWLEYSRKLEDKNTPNPDLFMQIESSLLKFNIANNDFMGIFSTGQKIAITENDLR